MMVGFRIPYFLGGECGSHGGFSAPLDKALRFSIIWTITPNTYIPTSWHIQVRQPIFIPIPMSSYRFPMISGWFPIDIPWFQDGLWPRLPVHRVGLRETHEAGTGRRGGTQWRRRELWRGAFETRTKLLVLLKKQIFFHDWYLLNIVTSSKFDGWMKLNDLMIEKLRIDLMIWWLSIFLF